MQTVARRLYRARCPPVLSMVNGKVAYNDYNSRSLMNRWVDHPQRMWDAINELLTLGIDLILHVGAGVTQRLEVVGEGWLGDVEQRQQLARAQRFAVRAQHVEQLDAHRVGQRLGEQGQSLRALRADGCGRGCGDASLASCQFAPWVCLELGGHHSTGASRRLRCSTSGTPPDMTSLLFTASAGVFMTPSCAIWA